MTDAGLVVLVSFISPFRAERDRIRSRLPEGEFVEIFVDTPIEECIARDPKGLYAQALRGEIKAFTGIDSPYEPPVSPELRLNTTGRDVDELVAEVEKYLAERGIIGSYGSDTWSILANEDFSLPESRSERRSNACRAAGSRIGGGPHDHEALCQWLRGSQQERFFSGHGSRS